MSNYETPLELRITLPNQNTYLEAGRSRRGKDARIICVRFAPEESDKIEEACKILGINSISHLVRHCAVSYSESLMKHRANWIKEKINASKEPNSS